MVITVDTKLVSEGFGEEANNTKKTSIDDAAATKSPIT